MWHNYPQNTRHLLWKPSTAWRSTLCQSILPSLIGGCILGLTISLSYSHSAWFFTSFADHKVANIALGSSLIFKSFNRLCLSALHYNTNADRMQAVTDEGRPCYSVVFPKAKKGDHAIRKIKTQASHGGYDVDGPQEVRDCSF